MTIYMIKDLATGEYLPDHDKAYGVWTTLQGALARIKSHWHIKWTYNYLDQRTWDVKHNEYTEANKRWQDENPFDQWWPKHYKLIELTEKEPE